MSHTNYREIDSFRRRFALYLFSSGGIRKGSFGLMPGAVSLWGFGFSSGLGAALGEPCGFDGPGPRCVGDINGAGDGFEFPLDIGAAVAAAAGADELPGGVTDAPGTVGSDDAAAGAPVTQLGREGSLTGSTGLASRPGFETHGTDRFWVPRAASRPRPSPIVEAMPPATIQRCRRRVGLVETRSYESVNSEDLIVEVLLFSVSQRMRPMHGRDRSGANGARARASSPKSANLAAGSFSRQLVTASQSSVGQSVRIPGIGSG